MPKIKIEKTLYESVKKYAENLGYSTADEFVAHLLEQIVNSDDLDGDVRDRLKGLGYIA